MISKTVLVVEDDDDLRRLFNHSLKLAGFVVRETADGTDALRIMEDTSPDIVVLDLGLRTLDGMSVRQEMAANPDMKDIPVLIVTGARFANGSCRLVIVFCANRSRPTRSWPRCETVSRYEPHALTKALGIIPVQTA